MASTTISATVGSHNQIDRPLEEQEKRAAGANWNFANYFERDSQFRARSPISSSSLYGRVADRHDLDKNLEDLFCQTQNISSLPKEPPIFHKERDNEPADELLGVFPAILTEEEPLTHTSEQLYIEGDSDLCSLDLRGDNEEDADWDITKSFPSLFESATEFDESSSNCSDFFSLILATNLPEAGSFSPSRDPSFGEVEEMRRDSSKDKKRNRKYLDEEVASEKCKESKRAYSRAHREERRAYDKANREKINERSRAYFKANQEKIKQQRSARREARKVLSNDIQTRKIPDTSNFSLGEDGSLEPSIEEMQLGFSENKKRLRKCLDEEAVRKKNKERNRAYYEAHKEERRAYINANREKINESARIYKKANKEKLIQRRLALKEARKVSENNSQSSNLTDTSHFTTLKETSLQPIEVARLEQLEHEKRLALVEKRKEWRRTYDKANREKINERARNYRKAKKEKIYLEGLKNRELPNGPTRIFSSDPSRFMPAQDAAEGEKFEVKATPGKTDSSYALGINQNGKEDLQAISSSYQISNLPNSESF